MVNFFEGFSDFWEASDDKSKKKKKKSKPKKKPEDKEKDSDESGEEQRPDNFISTIKKQLPLIKKMLWFGMPVVVSNVKLGKIMIRDPRVFYVTDFDDGTVTIQSVENPGFEGEGGDIDDEIELDREDDPDENTFTIPRDAFYQLLEPPNFQGADFQKASMTAFGGGGGGMM